MSNQSKKAQKSDCAGCYDNFYNSDDKKCWSLENATLVKKKLVHINDIPPWNTQPIRIVPTCWHGQYIRAKEPNQTC